MNLTKQPSGLALRIKSNSTKIYILSLVYQGFALEKMNNDEVHLILFFSREKVEHSILKKKIELAWLPWNEDVYYIAFFTLS